jgi:large-conductance mechanosensitive channel
MSDFKDQFKQFIATNGIIGITAGICIGSVTKDTIASLVTNVLFPLIVIILNEIKFKNFGKLITNNNNLQMFVFTFIFIQVAFYQLLGVDKNLEKKI